MTSRSDEALDAFIDALLDDDAEQLYDHAPCGYLTTTPDGLITKVNQTFVTMTGYDQAELVRGRRFPDLLSVGGQIYHETHFAPMLRMQGAAREIALDIVRADGSRLPVLVNAVMNQAADGAPRSVRIAVFDATQRREYERELLRERQRAETSEAQARALARALQRSLIPPAPPEIPGLDVAAEYRPAGDGSEVGGDFYDVFQVARDDWALVIGDVCGKGVEAAVITALARHTLRAAAVQTPSPAGALRALNGALTRSDSERYCTVAMLRLTRAGDMWRGSVACGGHPLPLVRSRDGAVTPVGTPGSLIGLFEPVDVTDTDVTLAPGDAVVLYTDGVPEGRHEHEFYGDHRLHATVATQCFSAVELAATLLADVLIFQEGVSRDDVAIVVARVP